MKKYDFILVSLATYFCGVGVLNPSSEKHYYEDEFTDGYIKVVYFGCVNNEEKYSKVTRHKLKWAKPKWAKEEEAYFVKYGRRYYLAEMQRVTY